VRKDSACTPTRALLGSDKLSAKSAYKLYNIYITEELSIAMENSMDIAAR
jgi:hypothetical protein